ncbi:hypothetical protein WN48_03765 [Eufriesea mexicana]|uniref:ELM2 domain-containing protein n=1 Tax=Eufriesea mexicana TaxID=516756 RepID=A0A310SEA8_9HYME|nr:hypothetical protein WN48_03765 [Eufriesea mexicana]
MTLKYSENLRDALGRLIARIIRPRNGGKYVNGVAEIPECRDRSDLDKEYRDFPEEKIWSPREEVNKWVPLYVFMARSVLTFAQESQGVSNRDAMENSCTGYAEQYITDVLHDSEYLPEVALKTLLTKELPRKLVTRWTPENVKDIVDFYYAWKWSDSAKQLRNCRRRRRPNAKRRFPSIGCIFGELSSPKIVTRSVTAATRLSLQKGDQTLSVANLAKSSRVVRKRRSGSLAVR